MKERVNSKLNAVAVDIQARALAIENLYDGGDFTTLDLWHKLNFLKQPYINYFIVTDDKGNTVIDFGVKKAAGIRYITQQREIRDRGRMIANIVYSVDRGFLAKSLFLEDSAYIIIILTLLILLGFAIPLFNLAAQKRTQEIIRLLVQSENKQELIKQCDDNNTLSEVAKRILNLLNKQERESAEKAQIKIESSKNAAIANLTRHLAHDIRKPLSQVGVILDAFEMFKSNPSRLNAAKKDVSKAVNNIQGMLSDVMNFSRESYLETEPKSIGGTLDYVVRQVVLEHQNIDITFNYAFKAKKKLLIDESRFSRTLSNIIGNGIEAITEIGNKKSGVIDISTNDYDHGGRSFIEITIGNDGPLFPEGVETKLFESFYTSGKAKGTGLGLASAKKIVDLHRGEIFARNRSDSNGVEFIIRIPASTEMEFIKEDLLPEHSDEISFPEEDLSAIDILVQKLEGKVLKVILLEDEGLYRAWVKNLIQTNENLQKSVLLYDATNVDEALKIVEKEQPQFAIVDIDLGADKNGFTFLDAIKDKNQIKSIVHSNRTLDEFKQKAKSLGASNFIPKPLPLSSLVEFLSGEKIDDQYSSKKSETKWIYACDDTQLIRYHLEDIFKKFLDEHPGAFDFKVFPNGEELIAASKKNKPNLVLTDLNMRETGGKLDGYEVIKTIKGISKRVKVYLISNEPLALSEEPTKKAGGDGALEQPLSKEIIFPLLERLLARK